MEAAGQPADLVSGFAEPFPLAVVCDLVGLPLDERGYCLAVGRYALGALVTLQEGRAVTEELRRYVLELIDRKRRDPGPDVLSLANSLDGARGVSSSSRIWSVSGCRCWWRVSNQHDVHRQRRADVTD